MAPVPVAEEKEEEEEIGCFCNTDRHLPTNNIPFEGVWVACDGCDRWCHGECADVTKAEAEELESYMCPLCVKAAARNEEGAPERNEPAAGGVAAVSFAEMGPCQRSPLCTRGYRHGGMGGRCSFPEELPDAAVAAQLGQSLELRAESAAELGRRSRPYMDSADEAHDGALWPLVRRVSLRGPFAVCAPSALCTGGIRLLDAPGLHDDNAARDGVLRGVVAEAHSVLVVSNIRRACNDKGAKDMMPLPLRRALLSSGFAGALALSRDLQPQATQAQP